MKSLLEEIRSGVIATNEPQRIECGSPDFYINSDQYFEQVPEEAWTYRFGGYQVAQKWLADRKNRLLTFNELDHHRQVIGVINQDHSAGRRDR